jgi:hypothetical protein
MESQMMAKTVETVFSIVSSGEFTPLKRGVNHGWLSAGNNSA